MLGYDAISINLLKIKSIVRLTQPTIKNNIKTPNQTTRFILKMYVEQFRMKSKYRCWVTTQFKLIS